MRPSPAKQRHPMPSWSIPGPHHPRAPVSPGTLAPTEPPQSAVRCPPLLRRRRGSSPTKSCLLRGFPCGFNPPNLHSTSNHQSYCFPAHLPPSISESLVQQHEVSPPSPPSFLPPPSSPHRRICSRLWAKPLSPACPSPSSFVHLEKLTLNRSDALRFAHPPTSAPLLVFFRCRSPGRQKPAA